MEDVWFYIKGFAFGIVAFFVIMCMIITFAKFGEHLGVVNIERDSDCGCQCNCIQNLD